MPTEIERRFHQAMLEIYNRAVAETDYRPTYFRNMVVEDGGINAARKLLDDPAPSEGFATLLLLRRLDLSVEALVIQPAWRGMFTADELGRATTRLQEVGYFKGSPTPQVHDRSVPFQVGEKYTRRDIQGLIGVPASDGGDWATGHHREGNDTFIFPTIGAAGRTGHKYDNYWAGDLLHWETKGNLGQSAAPVQAMLHPPEGGRVYVFTREADRDPFVFEGLGHAVEVSGDHPVKIVWELESRGHLAQPGELVSGLKYVEGATRQIIVLAYERDPSARRKCVAHHGCRCGVCGLDFAQAYGDIGRGFIHVHHLRPLSASTGEREVDPVNDLRPVCPNCHAMLHAMNPPLSIEELIERVRQSGWLLAVQSYSRENENHG